MKRHLFACNSNYLTELLLGDKIVQHGPNISLLSETN